MNLHIKDKMRRKENKDRFEFNKIKKEVINYFLLKYGGSTGIPTQDLLPYEGIVLER